MGNWVCVCVSGLTVFELVGCFFFQAEDGIRDAQESRGLGDVYKRQAQENWFIVLLFIQVSCLQDPVCKDRFPFPAAGYPVSYTHLTLPTIYSV